MLTDRHLGIDQCLIQFIIMMLNRLRVGIDSRYKALIQVLKLPPENLDFPWVPLSDILLRRLLPCRS